MSWGKKIEQHRQQPRSFLLHCLLMDFPLICSSTVFFFFVCCCNWTSWIYTSILLKKSINFFICLKSTLLAVEVKPNHSAANHGMLLHNVRSVSFILPLSFQSCSHFCYKHLSIPSHGGSRPFFMLTQLPPEPLTPKIQSRDLENINLSRRAMASVQRSSGCLREHGSTGGGY